LLVNGFLDSKTICFDKLSFFGEARETESRSLGGGKKTQLIKLEKRRINKFGIEIRNEFVNEASNLFVAFRMGPGEISKAQSVKTISAQKLNRQFLISLLFIIKPFRLLSDSRLKIHTWCIRLVGLRKA